ncbi:MAG: hypothetical protein V3V10_06520, partial [Planctomycetota bacterium]
MWKTTASVTVALLLVSVGVLGVVVMGGERSMRGNSAPVPDKVPAVPELPTLHVFEWGVQTINFDGTAQELENLPAHFHKAEDIKLEVAPVKPEPEIAPKPPRPGPMRKPVLYFECSKDVTFDLDVHVTSGQLTWLYPKANRRMDSRTLQWDNIKLYADSITDRDKTPLLTLPEVDAAHWAAFSREGSNSTISVNGESERYLFYEGEPGGLPEV